MGVLKGGAETWHGSSAAPFVDARVMVGGGSQRQGKVFVLIYLQFPE